MNGYETKKKYVESGKSRIFNNWHKSTGVSMNDFLEGLKWVCEDPMPDGKMTRELGIRRNGTLVHLTRVYHENGDFAGFYDKSKKSNQLWANGVSISARDSI